MDIRIPPWLKAIIDYEESKLEKLLADPRNGRLEDRQRLFEVHLLEMQPYYDMALRVVQRDIPVSYIVPHTEKTEDL